MLPRLMSQILLFPCSSQASLLTGVQREGRRIVAVLIKSYTVDSMLK